MLFIGFKTYFGFVLLHMRSKGYREAKRLFGERVQTLRKERGITQEQFAERIDKSVEHISYIERGYRAASFETILDIAVSINSSPLILKGLTWFKAEIRQ